METCYEHFLLSLSVLIILKIHFSCWLQHYLPPYGVKGLWSWPYYREAPIQHLSLWVGEEALCAVFLPNTSFRVSLGPSEWYREILFCCIPWGNVAYYLPSRALRCIQLSAFGLFQQRGRDVPNQTIPVVSQIYILKLSTRLLRKPSGDECLLLVKGGIRLQRHLYVITLRPLHAGVYTRAGVISLPYFIFRILLAFSHCGTAFTQPSSLPLAAALAWEDWLSNQHRTLNSDSRLEITLKSQSDKAKDTHAPLFSHLLFVWLSAWLLGLCRFTALDKVPRSSPEAWGKLHKCCLRSCA